MTGFVFDIQRFSIHDGPGIRTTVFLKGCPLQCVWCHNPESWSREPQVMFFADKCIGCGACLRACPVEGAVIPEGERRIDRCLCTGCGACADACPAAALTTCGREMTVAEVIAEVEKDRPFYETSEGGMTVSGGEPLMQPEFTVALLEAARDAGLHTALDTSGYGERDALAAAARAADLILFDLKLMDAARHMEAARVDNADIHRNLRLLADLGVDVVVRVPLAPGYTDDPENVTAIARFAAGLPNVRRVDLMRFNRLGESKWRRLGREYPLEGIEAQDDETMDCLVSLVEAEGLACAVSG